jgi:hypothetical protein
MAAVWVCGEKRPLSETTRHLAVSGVWAGPAVEAPPEQRMAWGQRAARSFHSHRSCLIGVGKALASPPSEPCVRFSRTRLSSW